MLIYNFVLINGFTFSPELGIKINQSRYHIFYCYPILHRTNLSHVHIINCLISILGNCLHIYNPSTHLHIHIIPLPHLHNTEIVNSCINLLLLARRQNSSGWNVQMSAFQTQRLHYCNFQVGINHYFLSRMSNQDLIGTP